MAKAQAYADRVDGLLGQRPVRPSMITPQNMKQFQGRMFLGQLASGFSGNPMYARGVMMMGQQMAENEGLRLKEIEMNDMRTAMRFKIEDARVGRQLQAREVTAVEEAQAAVAKANLASAALSTEKVKTERSTQAQIDADARRLNALADDAEAKAAIATQTAAEFNAPEAKARRETEAMWQHEQNIDKFRTEAKKDANELLTAEEETGLIRRTFDSMYAVYDKIHKDIQEPGVAANVWLTFQKQTQEEGGQPSIVSAHFTATNALSAKETADITGQGFELLEGESPEAQAAMSNNLSRMFETAGLTGPAKAFGQLAENLRVRIQHNKMLDDQSRAGSPLGQLESGMDKIGQFDINRLNPVSENFLDLQNNPIRQGAMAAGGSLLSIMDAVQAEFSQGSPLKADPNAPGPLGQ